LEWKSPVVVRVFVRLGFGGGLTRSFWAVFEEIIFVCGKWGKGKGCGWGRRAYLRAKAPVRCWVMRPKAKALGYLFVAGLGEEQRQERETAGSFAVLRMTTRNANARGKEDADSLRE
jgi:hypothetical protein